MIIDYLGLLKAITRGSIYEKVTELSADIKALAIELEIPILLMCQLSRDVGKSDEPPKLEHLRDSGSIEQDSNNVIFVHRKLGSREATIVIAKQRQGEVQAFEMRFNPSRCSFEDIDAPSWSEESDNGGS